MQTMKFYLRFIQKRRRLIEAFQISKSCYYFTSKVEIMADKKKDHLSWTKSSIKWIAHVERKLLCTHRFSSPFWAAAKQSLKNIGKYMELVQDFTRISSDTVWIQSFGGDVLQLIWWCYPMLGDFLHLVCWRLALNYKSWTIIQPLNLPPNLSGLDVARIHWKCLVIVINVSSLFKVCKIPKSLKAKVI